ncbi:class I SAM-dependent methyltransferase [Streptomyces sp. NBC_01217]|uniref:class I SAM-dependent methyltransferase n=1 Tax=Streptomyces sp. NBC_01217 TaxID=2903779 RepID=UPI002E0DB324|nr:class I SAM-dependent methyltransferase [Streptomyces sp. NBC_01217]
MNTLRGTFDEDAELYDRMRPHYPAALVTELAALSGLTSRSRVLEVGPGTGQLTVALAEPGCELTAVELGPSLAAVARRNLRGFPRAHVEVSPFEEWTPPPDPFDLVVCATAIHWIDPARRFTAAADALRPGGTLAIVTTHHVAGGSEEFFAQAQRCYERWDPATRPGVRLSDEASMNTVFGELEHPPWDGPVRVGRHAREITYTAEQYLDLLMTYSGHRDLAPGARNGLLACIRALIEKHHGGRITKRYLHELLTVRRGA